MLTILHPPGMNRGIRRAGRWWAVLMLAGITAGAPGARAAADSAAVQHKTAVTMPAGNTAAEWLRRLDERGKTLHSFTADIRMTVHHLRTDEKDINIGRIWYQTTKAGARFDIHFNILVVDGAIARRHADHDIVFDGRWLIDRDGAAKIYRKIELAPPGRKYDPLKIGQGPIPIPIGQNPAEVAKRFAVTVAAPGKGNAGLIHLVLVPRDSKAFTFRRIELWIDPKIDLPVKILRIDPDSTPTLAVFTKVSINQPMKHDFHVSPPPAGAGWTVDIQKN